MSAALLDLAARVEQLTGQCRETDGDIAAALALHPAGWRRGVKEASATAIWFNDKTGQSWTAPAYTASLDAAMTLVLEGYPITEFSYWPSVPKGYESERCCRLTITDLDVRGFGGRNRFRAQALTPAFALTAASLRARSALEVSRG